MKSYTKQLVASVIVRMTATAYLLLVAGWQEYARLCFTPMGQDPIAQS
jgi:hypothetical protein